ncbi:MAG TPA: hypothetical protein VKU82_07370 [Planctomycetaceae bacterium]|nr:hypothetical protein [Planctomycetaceae bacterium]
MIALNLLLADHQEFHSDLQMDAFITLRSGGTLYGCYKQALRELHRRTQGLRDLYSRSALAEIDADELTAEAPCQFERRRNRIKAAEKRLALQEFQRAVFDTEREFLRFYGQAVAIREALAAQGIAFPLDAETRDRLDREMWEHKIKCMAAVDFIAHGRLNVNTVELLQALPAQIRRRVAEHVLDASRHAELIDWFLSYEPDMPAPAKINAGDLPRLIGCEFTPSSAPVAIF